MSEPTMPPEAPTSVADQRLAFAVLAQIADSAPGLPPAYITVYDHIAGLHAWSQTASAFEHWRSALGIAPAAVDVHVYAHESWMSARTEVGGVRVEISADVPTAPALVAVSPRQDAERRARVEQLAAATVVRPLQDLADGAR